MFLRQWMRFGNRHPDQESYECQRVVKVLLRMDGKNSHDNRNASNWSVCILLSVVVSMLTLVAAEVLYPALIGVSRAQWLMGFYALPNSVVSDVKINPMGFTGDVLPNERKSNIIRVLTLGGSAFFNRRMTDRLKKYLAPIAEASGQTLEILGGALRTHTTRSSVLKFEYLQRFQFDFVLIYHGINDLWINPAFSDDGDKAYSHISAWYDRGPILNNCVICRLIYNKLVFNRPSMKKVEPESEDPYPTLKLFEKNVSVLIRNIREAGSIPILMSFAWSIPNTYSEKAFWADEVGYHNPEKYDRCAVELWGPVWYVRAGLEKHNDIIRKVAERQGILLIDQEQLIGKHLQNFGDVVHLSDEGTAKFVSNIAKFFSEKRLFESARVLDHARLGKGAEGS
jgi:hypothetical protein